MLGKEGWGLEIRNLSILNKVLLGKWKWRFATKRESLWNHNKKVRRGGQVVCERVGDGIKNEWEGIKSRSHSLLRWPN